MISVLVPLRETGDGWRVRVWGFLAARLRCDHPDIEVVVATDDGKDPFNKSMAVNAAAREAVGEVLYILDADTYVPPAQVLGAAQLLADGGWARPWNTKIKLNEAQTREILEQRPEDWDGTYNRKTRPERINAFWSAPPLMLPRWMFDEAGGMDERYRGWGGEDSAFARSLWKLGHGHVKRTKGSCLHLWHPRIGTYGADLWKGQDGLFPNRYLDQQYNRANSAEAMREVIKNRGVG